MIQFKIKSKGKLRDKAVLKTMQTTQSFNTPLDENGMISVCVPCQLFEDQECRSDGLQNELERLTYIVPLPKAVVDAYNKGIYEALMKHPDIKGGIKV